MLELVIEGGDVVDGTGAPRFRADVGVDGGRIVAVGDLGDAPARRRLPAGGRVVAPGFIDVHTHDDLMLLREPECLPKLLQGVTTVVTGNCGVSLAPLDVERAPPPLDIMGESAFRFPSLAHYLSALEVSRPAVNAAVLVGHTTLRVATMADLGRPARRSEVAKMQRLLAESLDAGAIGLSTGVYYPPARAATTEEMIEVGHPLAHGRGLLTMHIRDEGDAIDAALREALAVGRALDVPLVISHHKLMGVANHGRSTETLALIESAARGQSVCMDCYPYVASSTMLMPERVGVSSEILVTWSRADPAAAGRSLLALARERGVDPAQLAAQLQPGGAVYFAMSDEDVDRILAHPLTMIGSDGLPHDAHPHPRLWGTFPRVLGHYARERGVLGLESAVHKMTGLPARRFGLAGRGTVAPGCFADLTVFDPATIADRATFSEPARAGPGVEAVIVAGEVAAEQGRPTGARRGALLRRRKS